MMLDRFARAVIIQARGFMILVGYIMAATAFFATLAQTDYITPELRVLMWALLSVPFVYLAAVTVESIAKGREHT